MDKAQRKERVSAWKERHPQLGVASLTCTATGEQFLAVARDSQTWFNRHRFELSDGTHRNRHLQELWNRYGEAGFTLGLACELEYKDLGDVTTAELKELLALCLEENPQAKAL